MRLIQLVGGTCYSLSTKGKLENLKVCPLRENRDGNINDITPTLGRGKLVRSYDWPKGGHT
jgi:hypothetical protein